MFSRLDVINYTVTVSGLMISLLGIIQTYMSRYMQRRTRSFFFTFFYTLSAYSAVSILEIVSYAMSGGPWAMVARVSLFLESMFSSLLMVMLTAFLLYYSGEQNWRKAFTYRLAFGLWLIYFALLVYTQFSKDIYYYDEMNQYHRGPLYPLLLFPPAIIMLVNTVALWKRRGKLTKRQQHAFAAYLLIPLAAMLIQMVYYGVYLIILASAVSALIMFLYIQADQEKLFERQKQENERLKADILVAQIQPHFLFNALTVIRYLCSTDPKKAEEALDDLSAFLRHNVDSLSETGPVPFETELAHVRHFLKLQKLRFEDDLKVSFDLECTDFNLPSLTLQPLVENAVSYGLKRPDGSPGIITIRTRRFADRVEVSVEDNGPGFDMNVPIGKDGRSHIGIRNVQDRLRLSLGARLTIRSSPGEGTVATIILPQ